MRAIYFIIFVFITIMVSYKRLLIIILSYLFKLSVCDKKNNEGVRLTLAAARPQNELWCYKCSTSEHADQCIDITTHSNLIHKCRDDRRQCTVRKYSYTTSNENTTTSMKMWSLERNCTKNCQPGCIVIGERTKLYACTSCCNASLCNSGSDADFIKPITFLLIFTIILSTFS